MRSRSPLPSPTAGPLAGVAVALLLALVAAPSATAGRALPALDHLPPELPWEGASRSLALPPDHPWATPAERSGLTATPRYAETVSWLERLVAAAPELEMVPIGESAEGRTIWMVVASRAEEKSPAGLEAGGRPTVLVQAGIHSGEIDGKDAGMMLLRDMTVLDRRRELLDGANLLFVPILNVDGHERFSAFSRINQRGPVEMGWRTNARNLNLNRDYTKLETAGVRAVVGVIRDWNPDLYLDLHVTDGLDVQYDVTWGATPDYAWSPAISRWVEAVMAPAIERGLTAMGHLPGPFIWGMSGRDLSEGAVEWMGPPRFSHTYGAARHLPTILVENHSLKAYDRRVLATYVLLATTLELAAAEADSLAAATAADRSERRDPLVLDWRGGEGSRKVTRRVPAVRSETYHSEVTGGEVVRWTGEPVEQEVVFHFQDEPAAWVSRPACYWIPAAWGEVADKLRLHGIELEPVAEATTVEAEMLRLPGAGLAGGGASFDEREAVFEGRARVDPGEPVAERRELELPAGSWRASTDQPLGDLLILLLEPESPDSLFQWGYFLEILSRTEYVEPYVMEPMARAMLEADPELAGEFEARLAEDEAFAGDERARLRWFYERTPYFDERYRLYPVGRCVEGGS